MDNEEIYPNIKYRKRLVPAAVVMWLAFYFAPGIVVGRLTRPWLGVAWMLLGAALFAAFEWRCFFPKRLVVDRDGFRIERAGLEETGIVARLLRIRSVTVSLGWDKIHEARWIEMSTPWRRLFGPVIFIEPFWLIQKKGDRRLLVSHAGAAVVLQEDEIAHLEKFVDMLRKKNTLGLDSKPPRRVSDLPFGNR